MKIALSEKLEAELVRRGGQMGLSGTDMARMILAQYLFGSHRSQMVPNGAGETQMGQPEEGGTFKEGEEAPFRGEGVGGEGEVVAVPASFPLTQKLLETSNEESTGARALQPSGQVSAIQAAYALGVVAAFRQLDPGLLAQAEALRAESPSASGGREQPAEVRPQGEAGNDLAKGAVAARGGSLALHEPGATPRRNGGTRSQGEPGSPVEPGALTEPVAEPVDARSGAPGQPGTPGSGFESRSVPTPGRVAHGRASSIPGDRQAVPASSEAGFDSPSPTTTDPPRPAAKQRGSRPKAAPAEDSAPPACFGPALLVAIGDFRRYRVELGKPLTPVAVSRLYAELERWPDDVGVKAINDSILNAWRGVFVDELAAKQGAKRRVPTNGTPVPGQPEPQLKIRSQNDLHCAWLDANARLGKLWRQLPAPVRDDLQARLDGLHSRSSPRGEFAPYDEIQAMREEIERAEEVQSNH